MAARAPSFTRWIVVALAAYALLGGAITLTGWYTGLPRLTDWLASGIAMFPNTALSALCSGTALILAVQRWRWCRWISGLLGLLVLLLGGATLLQHLAGIDLRIDAMLSRVTWGNSAAVSPGRMGPPASTSYTLIGLALLLLNSRHRRARRFAPALGIGVTAIAALALMGYALGANPLFAIARYTGIAMQTASLLLALGLGILCSVPECDPVRTFTADSAAGMLARRSLPFIVVVPLVLGWVRVRAEQMGWYDPAMGTALLMLLLVFVYCGLLLWWLGTVSKHEEQVRQSRDALNDREKERMRLLESERAARTDAENAGRVKDEFLATLSHELRTPLNAILGWSRLIDQSPDNPRTVRDGIQVIARNAKIQADLIADLLDMSRIVSGNLRLDVTDVNLADVVNVAVDAIRHSAAAKGIRIETILSPAPPPVRGDAGRLQQVIWNLLTNAIKFTPKGERVQIVVAKNGSNAEISVSDTGIGIPAEFLPHVFERFRQADASSTRYYGGLGLGLSIAKHLVELHGGSVAAHSSGAGQGATFTILLPFALLRQDGPRDAQRSAPAVTAEETDLAGVRVLAIDDQADTRELLARILRACRADVRVACSSDEALGMLKEYDPHVVLCDIGMPGKDGYQFVEEMQSRGHAAAAVAVTAFARREDRLRAMRAGYQGHIAKPVEPAELLATIAAFARRRAHAPVVKPGDQGE